MRIHLATLWRREKVGKAAASQVRHSVLNFTLNGKSALPKMPLIAGGENQKQ
jgi:hypothetical protein